MVGTEVGAIEAGAMRRQQLDESALYGAVRGRVVQAARDADWLETVITSQPAWFNW